MAKKNNMIAGQMSIFDFIHPVSETPIADKLRAEGWVNMYDETPPEGFYEVCNIENPKRIWVTQRTKNGWWNPKAKPMGWWRPTTYKSDEEIYQEAILHGTGFAGGKKRVIEFFGNELDQKKRAEFLKNEYGVGGWSTDYGCVDCNANGLDFKYFKEEINRKSRLVHTGWPMVANKISELIGRGLYTADVKPVTKNSCGITGLECNAHSNKGCSMPDKRELIKEVVENNHVCEHSGHTCNKEELWNMAKKGGTNCHKTCCRECDISDCRARCNGSNEPTKPKTAPIVYHEGDIIYQVLRAEVIKWQVCSRTWEYDTTDGKGRGYDIKGVDDPWRNGCVWNSSTNFYRTQKEAENEAAKMLNIILDVETTDGLPGIILAKDMVVKTVVCYSHVTKAFYKDGRPKTIYDWYAILENGYIYLCSGSKYSHISTNIEKGIKEFEHDIEQLRKANIELKKVNNYKPQFLNMYKIGKHEKDGWSYAQAEYRA